ncbi:MAG: ribonuclease D [Thermodesulfobacteriota bacterium]
MNTNFYHYIASESDLEETAAAIAEADVIAVDVEADSMFHFTERVCLIQMATETGCYIVDPLAVGDLSPMAPVFADPSIIKVFHGADYDVRSLYRDFYITISNLFDTELASRFLGYTHTSLDAVLHRHFDVALDKKFQKKDWSRRPLNDEMLSYAADDVRYLVALYHELKSALAEKERLEWVWQTCAALAGVRPDNNRNHGDEQAPLFLRVKGAGRLDQQSLAVLEQMLRFRYETARKKDRPPFKIISNKVLLELAKIKPDTASRLYGTRLLSEKQYHMYGQSLVAAICTGKQTPKDRLPVYPRKSRAHVSPAVTRRTKALKKWRDDKAKKLEIDPAMLVSKAAMQQIAEKVPKNLDELRAVEELKPWQIRAFGKQWLRLMEKTDGSHDQH